MNIGLVISTYNQPHFLQLVLRSVLAQSRLPDEIIIADDGSSDETRLLLEGFENQLSNRPGRSTKLIHCWQSDDGFRKTRILNRAILAASAKYLIFSDGDMVLHRDFISDHAELATEGRFTQGRRICMNQTASLRHLKSMKCSVGGFERGLNRRLQTIRNRWLMRRLSTVDCSLKNSRGCNQAFWRNDLLQVNGYEEHMQGWGREDSELCARMHNAGVKRVYARHWALAFHLYHPELSRENDERNSAMLDRTIVDGKLKADVGIEQAVTGKGHSKQVA